MGTILVGLDTGVDSYHLVRVSATSRDRRTMACYQGAEHDADNTGVTRLLLLYCSLFVLSSELFPPVSQFSELIFAVLYPSVVYAFHCSPIHTLLQVTLDTG